MLINKYNRKDEDWEAIYDAQTLAAAEIIKADSKRLKAAKKWAAKLVEEEKEETEAMAKVANS